MSLVLKKLMSTCTFFLFVAQSAAASGVDVRPVPIWQCQDHVNDSTTTALISQRADGPSFVISISMYDSWQRQNIILAKVEDANMRTRIPGLSTLTPIENYFGKDSKTDTDVDIILTPHVEGNEADGILGYERDGEWQTSELSCRRL